MTPAAPGGPTPDALPGGPVTLDADRPSGRLSGRGLAHPFVTEHPFGWTVARSWSDGRDDDGAAAVAQIVPPDGREHTPVLVGVGEPGRLAELLVDTADLPPDLGPGAVSLTRGTGERVAHLLAGWGLAERSAWDHLGIERPPGIPPGTPDPAEVELLDVVSGQGASQGRDAAAIVACLAASNPTTTHRPGDARTTWYGWRDPDGSLAAVACSTTPPSGGLAHLGAIGTRPDRRGHGLAAAVTARATLDGVGEHGLVVLGMYDDNHAARRLYERLGFRTLHEVETWRPPRA